MEAQSLSYDRSVSAKPEKQHTKMFFITFKTMDLKHGTFIHQCMSLQNISQGYLIESQSPPLFPCPFCKPLLYHCLLP